MKPNRHDMSFRLHYGLRSSSKASADHLKALSLNVAQLLVDFILESLNIPNIEIEGNS